MKKYKWLIILVLVIITLSVISIIFSDNPDKYIKEIGINEVIKKQKHEDSFILYIKSTNCEHCKVFTPRLTSVLKENKLKAYALNLANLSEEEPKKIQSKTIASSIFVPSTAGILIASYIIRDICKEKELS